MLNASDSSAVDQPPQAAPPRVVAVVLTWNDVELTRSCLTSLLASDWLELAIVLVDNGSTKPVLEALCTEFPQVHALRLDENQGFAGGCNRGIERALEMEADYVFLVNNDTVIDPDAVPQLVHAMQERRRAAVASAILLDPGLPKTVQSYRGWINRNRASISRPDEGSPLSSSHRATVPSEFVSACAILLRSEALREVGLFDERLFVNWEDYDLCLRMSDAGWELLMVGTAEVVHRRHQTTGSTSPYITYYGTRNHLICLLRHGSFPGLLWNLPYIGRTFLWRIRGYGMTNWQGHRAFLWAWLDFLLGVRGRGHAPQSTRNASRKPSG